MTLPVARTQVRTRTPVTISSWEFDLPDRTVAAVLLLADALRQHHIPVDAEVEMWNGRGYMVAKGDPDDTTETVVVTARRPEGD